MYDIKPIEWVEYRPSYDPHYKNSTGTTPFCTYKVYENNSPAKAWWCFYIANEEYPQGNCQSLENGIRLAEQHYYRWLYQALVKLG